MWFELEAYVDCVVRTVHFGLFRFSFSGSRDIESVRIFRKTGLVWVRFISVFVFFFRF